MRHVHGNGERHLRAPRTTCGFETAESSSWTRCRRRSAHAHVVGASGCVRTRRPGRSHRRRRAARHDRHLQPRLRARGPRSGRQLEGLGARRGQDEPRNRGNSSAGRIAAPGAPAGQPGSSRPGAGTGFEVRSAVTTLAATTTTATTNAEPDLESVRRVTFQPLVAEGDGEATAWPSRLPRVQLARATAPQDATSTERSTPTSRPGRGTDWSADRYSHERS